MAGEIDNLEIKIGADASDAADHIRELANALSSLGQQTGKTSSVTKGLDDTAAALKNFKGIRTGNITQAVDNVTDALERIGQIGGLENTVALLDSIQNIQEATSGLRQITENIKSLKVNKTFETNLDNLKSALQRLNDLGDTSAFQTGVDSVAQSVERLNNIDVGEGFFNLVSATTQWQDALERLNEVQLGSDFSQGIARIARAAEILNDVDFSGFTRMHEALESLPENVRISFGASSEEIQGLTSSLTDLQSQIETISSGVSSLANKKTKQTADTTDEKADENIKAVGEASQESLDMIDRFSNGVVSALKRVVDVAQATASPVMKSLEMIGDAFGKLSSASVAAAVPVIKAVFSPLTKLGEKFKAASIKAGQFLSSIKRIAMYRAVRSAIKAVTEGFAEGRKNLYYYSQEVGTEFAPSMDKAATAALYLKNSIGAATAPLTNYLVPMIDVAVDHIVELINKFNELTAVLTGQSTWTKAIKYPTQWQDALDDANKSAKKLKRTMLGFDELNVIEPDSGGVKAKALDMEDYSKMFQEMQTSATWKNKIPDLLIPVKLAWDAEGDNTIRTIKNTWNDILGLIGAVGDSFRKVWDNGTGKKSLELILQITQNIVGTFGALAKNIRKAWDEGEKGTKIIQSVWNVANNLLTVFRDIWGSIREWAEGLDWNPLLDAFGSLWDAIDKLTNPESGAMQLLKGLFNDVLLPLGKWTIESAAPLAIAAFSSAVTTLTTLLDKLQPVAKQIWDDWFKPVAEWAGSKLIDDLRDMKNLLDDITKMLNGEKSLKDVFDLGTESGTKNATKAIEKITSPFSSLSMFSLFNPSNWDAVAKAAEKIDAKFSGTGNQNKAAISLTGANAGVMDNPYLSAMNGEDDIEQAHFFKDFADNFKEGMQDIENAIANSTIGQFFTNLFDSTQDFGVWLYDFTHDTWPQFWEGIGEKAFDAVDGLRESWRTGLEDIKKRVGDAWAAVKKTLSDGWDKITGFVTSYVNGWKSGFNDIKTDVSNAWDSITDWIGNNLTWDNLKSKVSDYASSFTNKFTEIKTSVSTKFTEIKSTVTGFFDDIDIFKKAAKFRDDILDFFGGILGKDNNSGVKGKFNEIKNAIVGVFEKISQSVKNPINDAISGIETFANSVIDAIGDILQRLQSLTSGARAAFEKVTGISLDFGWNIKYIHLDRLANGGMPTTGQLFLAREAGPELVGQFGNHTGVMNNQQIVSAVSDGVYRAMMTAMAQNENGRTVIENHLYLDRQEITSAINQQESANGVPIIGSLVYT